MALDTGNRRDRCQRHVVARRCRLGEVLQTSGGMQISELSGLEMWFCKNCVLDCNNSNRGIFEWQWCDCLALSFPGAVVLVRFPSAVVVLVRLWRDLRHRVADKVQRALFLQRCSGSGSCTSRRFGSSQQKRPAASDSTSANSCGLVARPRARPCRAAAVRNQIRGGNCLQRACQARLARPAERKGSSPTVGVSLSCSDGPCW